MHQHGNVAALKCKNMKPIKYIKGDATAPTGDDNKIIVHICNDIGGWGKGFVLAISKRWQQPEHAYRTWYKSSENFLLGRIQIVPVEANIWVANMIAQHGVSKSQDGNPPIRYEAVEQALSKVAMEAIAKNASVHMPRIGAGLAGGNWETIESIIIKQLSEKGITVTVYDLP
jgi:O-acetyl-ADP-ribose deacetylase (regulator of RNase III)